MTLAKDVAQGKTVKKVYKVDKPEIVGDPSDDNSPLLFTITTDAVDRDQDIVDPAGIRVDNYKNNAVMQWAHQYDTLPVGKSVEMFSTQIKAMKDGTEQSFNAIKARVEFQPDSNYHESYTGIRGSMVRRMYMTGFLNAVSIGFDPQEWVAIGGENAEEKTPSDLLNMRLDNGTRFTAWELLEFSSVPVPANPQALIDRDYKGQLKSWAIETLDYCKDGNCPTKGVIPYKQTPKAPEDTAWSGPAEVAAATVDDLKIMCAWFDSADATNKGAYKLPHHTASGHMLVKAGVVGAGNAIQGARGGVSIPPGDVPGVQSHLAKHYKEFNMTAPWEPKEPTAPKAEEGFSMKEIDELRERVKSLEAAQKAGRVFSVANEGTLKKIVDLSAATNEAAKGLLSQLVAPEPATAPAGEPKPAVPVAVAPTPPKSVSYPLGHDAPLVKEIEVVEPVVTEVIESENPIETPEQSGQPELFRVDLEVLAGVLGVDVETLESLTAQAEGEQTEE